MFGTLNSVTLLSSKNDILNVRVEDQILSSIIRDCQGNGHNPKCLKMFFGFNLCALLEKLTMLQKNKDFKPNSLLFGVGRSCIPLNITRFREIGISHLPIVIKPRRFALQTYSTHPSFTKGFILHSETRTSAPRMGGGKSCAATLPTTACVMSASSLVRTRSVSRKV